MTNEFIQISAIYPIISGVCSLIISLFGIFKPFICPEREFIRDANWNLSKIRGIRIDKLEAFISDVLYTKMAENNKKNSQNKVSYITNTYECFADDLEECIVMDIKIRELLSKYRFANTSFMAVIWVTVTTIVLSLLFNYVLVLNKFLNWLFYVSLLLFFVQLLNVICLRWFSIQSQDLYQHNILRSIKNEI